MDFWCHASALLALSWARACDSDLIKRRMHARGSLRSSCALGRERTAVSQSTQRDTVASSICVSFCVVTRVVLVHRLLESAR